MISREAVKKLLAEIVEAGCPQAWKERGDHLPEWRRAVYESVKVFPEEVVEEACRRVSESTPYLPSRHDIHQACVAVLEERGDATPERLHPKFNLEPHQCRACTSSSSTAFRLLAAVLPYEADHVCCPVERATCPRCGKRFAAVSPVIRELIEAYPEDTVGWREVHKGLLLCHECENHGQ
jgi:hypothetical protein